MAAGTIWTELNLDSQKFKIGLQRSTSDAQRSSKKIEADMKGMTDRVSSYLNGMAGRIGVAFGAYKIAGYIKDTAMLAARYETLGLSLAVVGQNLGKSGAELDRYAQQLQAAGISAIESRQSILRMATANLDLSKSYELARAAQAAAIVNNENSSETFNAFVHAISAGQLVMLKHRGIMITFEDAYKKWATEHGRTTDSLTAHEKVQIRLNAVIDEARVKTGLYEAAMSTAGKQITSTKRYVDDLQVKLGSVFNEALYAAVFAFNNQLKTMNAETAKLQAEGDLKAWGRGMILTASALANAFQPVIKIFQTIGKTLGFIGASAAQLGENIARLIETMSLLSRGDFRQAASVWVSGIDSFQGQIDAYVDDMAGVWGNWVNYFDKAQTYFAESDKRAQTMKDVMGRTGKSVLSPDTEGEAQAAEQARQATAKITDIMNGLKARINEAQPGLDKTGDALAKINNEHAEFIKKITDSGASAAQQKAATLLADQLRSLAMQNVELERQEKLRQHIVELQERDAQLQVDAVNQLRGAGYSGGDVEKLLQQMENYGSAESKRMFLDSVIQGGDTGDGGGFTDNIGKLGQLFGISAGPGLGKEFWKQFKSAFSGGDTWGKMTALGVLGGNMASAYSRGAQSPSVGMAAVSGVMGGVSTGVAAANAIGGAAGAAAGAGLGMVEAGLQIYGAVDQKRKEAKERRRQRQEEADKYSGQFKELESMGFLSAYGTDISGGMWQAARAEMDKYIAVLKQTAQEVGKIIESSLGAALTSQTATAAVESFTENFNRGFTQAIINSITQLSNKVMQRIITPVFQIADEIQIYFDEKWQQVATAGREQLRSMFNGAMDIISAIPDAWFKALEKMANMGGVFSLFASGLAGATYYAASILLATIVESAAGVLQAIANAILKPLEPLIEMLWRAAQALNKAFDTEPEWVKEMARAGIALESAMGKDAVQEMQSTWTKLKEVIATAMSDGFASGTASTGYQNFARSFKDGVYKWMVDAITKALAAGAIILPAIAPYLRDYVKLLVKSATGGGFDAQELSRIFIGITTNIDGALAESEGLFTDVFGLVRTLKNKLYGIAGDDATATTADEAAEIERKATGWEAVFSRVKAMWDRFGEFVERVLTVVDNVFYSFKWGLSSFLDRVLGWIETVFGVDFGPDGEPPRWYTRLMAWLEKVRTWVLLILGWRDKDGDGDLEQPRWYTWLTGAIDKFKTWVQTIFGWGDSLQDDGTPRWYTLVYNLYVKLVTWVNTVFGWGKSLDAYNGTPRWYTWLETFFDNIKQWIEFLTGYEFPDQQVPSVPRSGATGSAGALGSYAAGTGYVPRIGPYLLNQGDVVVPAAASRPGRGDIAVHIGQVVIREEMDIKRAAKELAWQINTQLAGGIA